MDTLSNESPKESKLIESYPCHICGAMMKGYNVESEQMIAPCPLVCLVCLVCTKEHKVIISYTNYKGISSVRNIIPKEIYFGSNQWHKEPQWLLKAFDLDKNADRNFAMADIHSWQ